MFKYYRAIDNLNHINRLLLATLFVFVCLTIWLCASLIKAPKTMEFWLSPAMSANGGLMKADEVSDEYVHGFVTALIPALNTWSNAGVEEFYKNSQAFKYYMTPRYRDVLEATRLSLEKAGIFTRTQTASLYRFLEDGDIKKLGSNIWEVHLLLRITQKLNEESAMVIADKVVDYHFRVVKVNLSKIDNPFGLAIDGYSKPETLFKDLLSKKETEEMS